MFTGEAENPSYQGFPPDLTGFTFVVSYNDGSSREIRDLRELQVFPPVLVAWIGEVDGDVVRVPHRHFEIRYGAVTTIRPLEIPASLTRMLIVEETVDLEDGLHNEHFWSAQGFHMHGANQMQDTYYVDDTPNFARLTGEAHFAVPSTVAPGGVGPVRVVREFTLTEANRWGGIHGVIQPRYDATPRSATGTGVFLATFARNPWFEAQRIIGDQSAVTGTGTHAWRDRWGNPREIPGGVNYFGMFPDPGLTAVAPLRAVYHVHGITFNRAPVIPAMFYWEPHLRAQADELEDRAALDADHWTVLAHEQGVTFNVTYSNGRTYVRTLDFLMNAPDVWWNRYNDAEDTVAPADRGGARPFWVGGLIRDSFPTFTNAEGVPLARNLARDPAGWGPNGAGAQEITFNYRGWSVSHPVVVWNQLVNFSARIADATVDRLEVDMTFAIQDNDNVPADGGATAAGFANRIVVEATWAERSNPENTFVQVLTYNNRASREWGQEAALGEPALEPDFMELGVPGTGFPGVNNTNIGRNFFMDFGEINDGSGDPWGHAFFPENNDLNGNVTIWYASPWIGGAPVGGGWIDDNLGREEGTVGQWQLANTLPINAAHDAEGWWWSKLGELRVATIPVIWRNIQ